MFDHITLIIYHDYNIMTSAIDLFLRGQGEGPGRIQDAVIEVLFAESSVSCWVYKRSLSLSLSCSLLASFACGGRAES